MARVCWGAGQAQGTEALGRGGSGRNVIRNEVGGPLFKNLLGN